ncbi:unnamed protein product [Candida verbasci]|uniref:EF-hand domain-containing protein n=1 Tax=Candida verbasci TaxID=1227364 RepID=A0A9W4X880_9ASCO|nr:unnamed protein product [Candida verbasci]
MSFIGRERISSNHSVTPQKNNRVNNNTIIKNELLDEQKAEIREAFQMFDMNGDGCLDYHELKVAFRSLGFDLSKKEVLDIIKEYDMDDSRLITYDNFYKTVGEMIIRRDPIEEIRRAFKLFDVDGTGSISLRNLRKVSKDLGENLTDEELQAMIDEFDFDEDGESTKNRFMRDISKYTESHKKEIIKMKQITSMPTFQNFFPDKLPRSKQKTQFEAGIIEGDFAYISQGKHKGKIAQVLNYSTEYDTVALSNITSQKLLPKTFWPEGQTSHVMEFPDFIPRKDIKVAGKEKVDEKINYIVADEIVLKDKYYDERYKKWIPRRFIKHHENIEIPWPNPSNVLEDNELSTPEEIVMEKTFEFQSIGKSPIPSDCLNELRNPYSKYKIKKLDGLQVSKLNGVEMPMTKEQKIWKLKQEEKPKKELVPLSDDIKEFIGEKMANHLNKIESPELKLHLEHLSKLRNRDFENTMKKINGNNL